MRSILITNDDGITDDGIVRLAEAAVKLGKVWVVAPDSQRSAASHSISLHSHIDLYPAEFPVSGVTAYTCSGSPADCVRTGSLSIMPHKPEIVLSGINRGYNTATDIQYSGTAGAAFEGAFQGALSIAFSEEVSDIHEVSEHYIDEILSELIEQKLDERRIFNVNFPGCPLSECKGIRRNVTVSRGMFYRDRYQKLLELPNGGMRLMVKGEYNEDCEEGTDFRAVVEKYISVGIVNNIS